MIWFRYLNGYIGTWNVTGIDIEFECETARFDKKIQVITREKAEVLSFCKGLASLFTRMTVTRTANHGIVVSPDEIHQVVPKKYRPIAYQLVDQVAWEIQQYIKDFEAQSKIHQQAEYDRRRNRPGYIYLVKGNGLYKIGRTEDPTARIKSLQNANGGQLETIVVFRINRMELVEKDLHARFQEKCVGREWFKLDDADADNIRFLAEQEGELWASTK